MDFTLQTNIRLFQTLKSYNYTFIPFSDYIQLYNKSTSTHHSLSDLLSHHFIILRHDVDKLPQSALRFAQMEHELGIKGTYYFRIVPESFEPKIIEEIAGLEHEIGYHYEDLSLVAKRLRENKIFEKDVVDEGIENFARNLDRLRKLVPIKTICMHGSPRSKWDSRLLWKYYNYQDWDVIAEPYFDLDFSECLYLTDTGRRWDGEKMNIRDKPVKYDFNDWKTEPMRNSAMNMSQIAEGFQQQYQYHSTNDILFALKNSLLPKKIMMTFHPQRWSENYLPWIKELLWQNVKNYGKLLLLKLKK